jgi:DNA-binding NarL/FixJ family response regulator
MRTESSPLRGRLPRVLLLSQARILRDHLDARICASGTLQCAPLASTDAADVVLCAAGSGFDLRAFSAEISAALVPRTVLYDLSGGLGPICAGIHGFRGYLPPDISEERLLRCIERVAMGQTDAPRPHLDALVRTHVSPPLDVREREILSLLALGWTHRAIEQKLGLKERTLDEHIARLKEGFDAKCGQHLGAIAVALGLACAWEDEPPTGWWARVRVGGGVNRQALSDDEARLSTNGQPAGRRSGAPGLRQSAIANARFRSRGCAFPQWCHDPRPV